MRSIVLAVALLAGFSIAHAAEKDWAWFVASSVADDWLLEKGTAKVTLRKDSFRAELYSGGQVRHRISGSRKANQLKAKLSTVGTGRVDYPLLGVYHKRTLEASSDAAGRETISLYWGGVLVGLTREIDK